MAGTEGPVTQSAGRGLPEHLHNLGKNGEVVEIVDRDTWCLVDFLLKHWYGAKKKDGDVHLPVQLKFDKNTTGILSKIIFVLIQSVYI